jgi:hypothetical protein
MAFAVEATAVALPESGTPDSARADQRAIQAGPYYILRRAGEKSFVFNSSCPEFWTEFQDFGKSLHVRRKAEHHPSSRECI